MDVAGVTLGDAVDLATPGSTPMEVSGPLDFQATPYAVSLYRIHLDQGHFWRLGLEVTAQRDGGSSTRHWPSSTIMAGRSPPTTSGARTPRWIPISSRGLNPGTYYLGVSGVGNLPGPEGGYDPATGSAGSVPQTQDGGALYAPSRGRPRG